MPVRFLGSNTMYCPSCGTKVDDSASSCNQCNGLLIAPAHYQIAARTDRVCAGYRITHLGDRLLAMFLDGILLIPVFALLGIYAGSRWGGLTGNGFSLEGAPALAVIAAAVTIALIYFIVLEGLLGRTIGKALLGIQVRRSDGSAVSIRHSFIRNLIRPIDAIGVYLVGLAFALFTRRRQRLGDLAAGTVVIDNALRKITFAAIFILWIALMALGAWGNVNAFRAAALRLKEEGQAKRDAVAPASENASVAAQSQPAAVSQTAPSGEFEIAGLQFTSGENGQQRPSSPYRPGEMVDARYAVRGYSRSADDQIDVLLSVSAFDPSGALLHQPWESRLKQQAGADSAEINGSMNLQLPNFVQSGTYKVVIKADDLLQGKTQQSFLEFEVSAPEIAPAASLEVRNLALGTNPNPLPAGMATLRAAERLYMAMNIFAPDFKDNKCDLQIDYKLLAPDGAVLMEKPGWLKIADEFYYHPPVFYLPVSGEFTLPADAAAGTYTQQYKIVDNISGRSVEHAIQFQVLANG